MRFLVVFLRVLGYVCLAVGAGLIIVGAVRVGISSGISAVMKLFSPFNISNYLVMLITLAPGIVLLVLADKLKQKIGQSKDARNL